MRVRCGGSGTPLPLPLLWLTECLQHASGEETWFIYDADGRRVRRHTVADTIVYVGSHYEEHIPQHDLNDDCVVNVVDIMLVVACWNTSVGDPDYNAAYDFDDDGDIDIADVMTVAARWRERCTTVKYYTLGGRRVAMRREPTGQANTLYYLFSDHLGSTSVVYNTTTQQDDTIRYYPYGSTRSGGVPTDRLFADQRFDGTGCTTTGRGGTTRLWGVSSAPTRLCRSRGILRR